MKGAQSQAQRRMPAPTSLDIAPGDQTVGQFSVGRRLLLPGRERFLRQQACLKNVNIDVAASKSRMIGPSVVAITFLRCLNRMNEHPGTRVTGSIKLDGSDIQPGARMSYAATRRHVFQSRIHSEIHLDNVATARIHAPTRSRADLDDISARACSARTMGRMKDRSNRPARSVGVSSSACVLRARLPFS